MTGNCSILINLICKYILMLRIHNVNVSDAALKTTGYAFLGSPLLEIARK